MSCKNCGSRYPSNHKVKKVKGVWLHLSKRGGVLRLKCFAMGCDCDDPGVQK